MKIFVSATEFSRSPGIPFPFPFKRLPRGLIALFTVTVANEAGVDLVMIQPFLRYYAKLVVVMLTSIFKAKFPLEKEGRLYQNNVNLSLTFTQRPGHLGHNCKMAY